MAISRVSGNPYMAPMPMTQDDGATANPQQPGASVSPSEDNGELTASPPMTQDGEATSNPQQPGASVSSPADKGNQHDSGTNTSGSGSGWEQEWQRRMQATQGATDPALKAHYQAELDVMRPTMVAMGIDISSQQTPAGPGENAPPTGPGESTSPTASEENAPSTGPGESTSPTASEDNAPSTGPEDSAAPSASGNNAPPPSGDKPKRGPNSVTPGNQHAYDDIIEKAAKKYNLDPLMIKAIIRQESDFDPNAVSESGCLGLMQLSPDKVSGKDPYDPETNIDVGAKYFRAMLDQSGGDYYKANMAYNAGPAAAKAEATPAGQDWSAGTHAKLVMGWYNDLKASGKVNTALGSKPTKMS